MKLLGLKQGEMDSWWELSIWWQWWCWKFCKKKIKDGIPGLCTECADLMELEEADVGQNFPIQEWIHDNEDCSWVHTTLKVQDENDGYPPVKEPHIRIQRQQVYSCKLITTWFQAEEEEQLNSTSLSTKRLCLKWMKSSICMKSDNMTDFPTKLRMKGYKNKKIWRMLLHHLYGTGLTHRVWTHIYMCYVCAYIWKYTLVCYYV